VAHPVVRLVGFHHAGGSAAVYYPLHRHLPLDWDLLLLDLPGRGKRHRMSPLDRIDEVLAIVETDVRECPADAPLALFGHSYGAILAAEVARMLADAGREPVWLGVSGRMAPAFHAQSRHRLAELTDVELMAELFAMGGLPEQAATTPEFKERFLATVRADLRAVDSYRPDPDRMRLSCPITVFGGTSDAWAPAPTLGAWAAETTGGFRQRLFPGGHFYFLGAMFETLATEIVTAVAAALAAQSRRPAQPRPLVPASGRD
jgi:surfactin synthase thioesterase subunit